MNKRNAKKILVHISLKKAENEADKAARRFFGTFVKDIKRNWVDGLINPSNWQQHLTLKGKPNVSQLAGSL